MGTIRVEAVPVKSYFLGLFGFDHLHLVYQDETDLIDRQDYWFVLEGIQDGPLAYATLGASGQNGTTTLGTANGAGRDALVAKIGTPESRGSRIIYSGPDAAAIWSAMSHYAANIDDQKFPYIAYSWPFSTSPTINSTSLISSVLHSAGIDLNNLMPFGVRLSPGAETILGTPGADEMTATYHFTTIATGGGNDTLHGSSGGIWLDKLYGGMGDDTLTWSTGDNILDGGQSRLSYAADGFDIVDYSGVGFVEISTEEHPVEHKVADFTADFSGGADQLFSIEEIKWDKNNDTVISGPGVELIEKPVELDLKGDSGGRGDEFGFSESSTPLLVNVTSNDIISVQALSNEGLDAGYWVKSAEWFTGSKGADKIYAGASLVGVEGGNGDDLIDARLANAFSGKSPLGFDIELYGGDGSDTLVSGPGRTFAKGGDGADKFVLSSMTSGDGTVEFVIDDASAEDKLYVPYNFFKVSRGDYEGSELFQLTGAVFKMVEDQPSTFIFADPGDDQVHGYIDFTGYIDYRKEGSDLLITLIEGHAKTIQIDYGADGLGPKLTIVESDNDTTTHIRVHNWSEGDLGITFPVTYDNTTAANAEDLGKYPGWHEAITAETSPDKFIDALDPRPDAHTPRGLGGGSTIVTAARSFIAPPVTVGTSGNDTIVATRGGPYHLSGGGGNDDITGSDGGDVIDGGAGNDVMRGGLGNDTYYVNTAGDKVIETARGGFDKVYSTIDYSLGQYVEHLTLEGNAVRGTGNALRNTIEGNGFNNILYGGDGDDTLAGNGGDDTLVGGNGGDGYVYELGDGHDTIIETGAKSGKPDVIVLAGQLKGSDINFLRNPDHMLDLTLTFADGGSLTVKDYFAATGPNIEGIHFASRGVSLGASGGDWSAAELAAKAAQAAITRNSAPVARDDQYAYAGASTVAIPIAALLANDTDFNGDHLTVSSLLNIAGGTAVLDGQGNVVINRAANGDGHVHFDYRISDGNGGASQAAFDISMIPNSAPVITSGFINDTLEDHAASGRIIATDADHNVIGYQVKAGAGPAKGSINIKADGSFIYTPNANANGSDSFTLTASDGLTAPIEKQFTLNIAAVNDAPIAHADSGFSIKSGESLKLTAAALLSNDSDVENDLLRIVSVADAKGGSAVRGADGSVAFKANADYTGTASFNYTISDGHGGQSTATVAIKVISDLAKPHIIVGTPGKDVLTSTHGNDVFVGKADSDVFVFAPGNGHDQINDFEIGNYIYGAKDVLDLRGTGFTGYDDLTHHSQQSGSDTIITLHDGGTIRLKAINENNLMIDNFRIF